MDMANYLAERKVPFEKIEWDEESRAAHEAEGSRLRGRHVARTALLKTPDGYVVAILPWAYEIDANALESLLGVRPILPAGPEDREALFPGWNDDFVPAVGSVFGIRTVMDIHLAGCAAILFRRSEDGDCVRVDLEDFLNLENPITGNFAKAPEAALV